MWLNISVLNNSPVVVTALQGTDTLPAGMTIASDPQPFASAGCGAFSAANFSAAPGGGSFGFSLLQIPAFAAGVNGVCEVYVRVQVTGPTGAAAGSTATLNNQILVGGVSGLEGVTPVSNTSSAAQTIQVTKLQNLTVAKSFSPTTVRMGETSSASITITNPNAARTVELGTITENLPASLSATNTPSVVCSGGGTPSVATPMGGSFPNLTFPSGTTMAGSGTCTITFTVLAAASNGTNSYTATNTVPAGGVGNSRGLTSAVVNTSLTVQSPLLTSKSFSPNPAGANAPVTMTITLQNRSAAAISALAFTDNLPAPAGAMTVLAPGGATAAGANPGGCSAASAITAVAGTALVAGAAISVPANSTCAYTVPVSVSNDGSYANTITNVTYTSADADVGVMTGANASATLTAYDQITATKAGQDPRNPSNSAGSVAPGNRIVYRVAISNYSLGALTDVQVTDPLPLAGGAQVTYVSSIAPTVSGASCSGPTSVTGTAAAPVFNGISVPAGSGASPSTCTLEFTVQVPDNWPANTAIVNTIPAGNITYNGGGSALQGAAVTDTRPYVDRLTIAKSVAPTAVFQGDTALVTVTLVNNSFNDMTGAGFTDSPLFGATNAVRVASAANPATTCGGAPSYTYTAGGSSFAVSGLTVPQRGSCTVSFRVLGVVPGGPYTNTIPAANAAGTVDNGAGPVTFNAAAAASASLTVNSVLNVGKSFSPSTVVGAGGVSRVSLTLQNVGVSALTNLGLSDPLPAGLAVANPAEPSTTCGGTPVVTAAPGAASVSLTGVTLYAATTCLVQFNVVSSVGTASVNTIAAGNVTADNGVFNASPASATLNKIASPGVNIGKAFSPAALAAVGSTSRLTVTVQNSQPGSVALTDLAFTDNMPAGMVIAPTPNAVSSCAGAVLTALPGASAFSMSIAALPSGASCVVALNVTLIASGSFVNTLPAGVVTNAQGVTNSDPFSSTLATLASLGVDKSFSPAAAAPGTPVLMRIRLINTLASAVSNLAFTDNLPAGLTPSTPSALSTTCVGASVSATSTTVSLGGGSLAAGSAMAPAICEVSLLVQSSGTGSFTNTIAAGGVTGTNDLGAPVSNNDPASAVFRGLQPVVVSKAFSNGNRVVGQVNRLTVTLANPNTSAISNVGLADPLPAGVYVATVPNASTTCASTTLSEPSGPISIPVTVTANAGATVARIAGATVAAGSSCEFAFDVVSHALGTWTNVIPEGSLTSHEGVTNANPASAPFTTLTPPTLGKQFSPVQIASGGSATLRISLGNPNASAITLTSALVDNLPVAPSQMRLSASTPLVTAQTTCTLGSITAAANATSVTYASGASIPPGGCVIVVNVTGSAEGTYNNVIAASGLQTSAGPNPSAATASLSITNTLASIAGRVFRDADNDGIAGAADVGIGSQTIELLDAGNAVVATVQTDSLGYYTFLGLAPGTYGVRQPSQPAGTIGGLTVAGPATAGGSAGVASAVTTSPSLITGIGVAGGQSSVDNNFAELVASRIAGRVYLDANNNGAINAAESGLAGVAITLTGTNDLGAAVNLVTSTAADGSYTFGGLRPGAYDITQGTQPTGTANGITSASAVNLIGTSTAAAGGSAGTPTPPTTTSVSGPAGTSRVANIVLPPNAESLANHFGEIATSRSVGGRVFTDANNDGFLGSEDAGIAGLTVTLGGNDASGNAVSRTTATASDGSFSFANLPESSVSGYTVSYVSAGSPANNVLGQSVAGSTGGTGASSGANRTLISGIALTGLLANSSNNVFTQRPPGSIAGRVFLDANNNGSFEPPAGGADAALAGQTLVLTGTDYGFDGAPGGGDDVTLPAVGAGGAVTATTAADGTYSFANLRPGSYNVVQPTQPAGSANGITSAGSVSGTPAGSPGTATAVGVTPSAINAIVLPPGGSSVANNFAEVALVTIGGTVFVDANRNDALDASDSGRIAGTTLTLVRGASCAAGSVIATATTDASGNYSFGNVPADGGYSVCQTQPVGYGPGASIGVNGTTAASNEIVIAALPVTGLADQNFAERPGSLAGAVYQDSSPATPAQTNNGVRDAGEGGVAGVPVTLSGTDARGNAVSLSVLTDVNGNYLFEGLVEPNAAGYTLSEGAIPAGSGTFNDGLDTLGNASTAAGSAAVNDVFSGVRIGAGQQASGYLFGELPIAPISGTVYIDSNRNNGLDASDGLRLPGVTVQLFAGVACSGSALASTVTDSLGNFSFSGISVGGNYVLCQTQPSAWANGNAAGVVGSNQITITNLPPAGSPGQLFGELPATLAGSVFLDAAHNGTREGADVGIAGVSLTLTGTDINGSAISRNAVTDASGNYLFADLPAAGPAGYTVTQQAAQPVVAGTATLNGITTRGTVSGIGLGSASAINSAPSVISALTLAAGAQSVDNRFAEILPVSVSGAVFIDANNNGVQNLPLDAGVAGASIVLTGTDDTGATVTRNLLTDANGVFSVGDLRPGTYTLTQPAQPAGTSNGLTVPGSAGGSATPITSVPSVISGIVLAIPGASANDNRFAEVPTSSVISGRVFADADNDGVFDAGESGLAGVTIELNGTDLAGQPVTRTANTAADGSYSFTNLPPGTFTLREPSQPSGTVNGITSPGTSGGTATPVATVPSAISAIPLGVGQVSTNHLFAELPSASISGRVFSDPNNNGVVDAGEPGIAGVSMVLSGTDDQGNAVNIALATGADGRYSFGTLRPGTYTVTQPVQPADTVNGITRAGTVNGTSVGSATSPAVLPSAVSAIVLPPAATSIDNDFAEIGNSPDLKVTKTHTPATFTVNNPGRYSLHVRNLGQVASSGSYTVSDRLPAGLILAATPQGAGWACTGAVGAASFECTSAVVIAAGAQNPNAIAVQVNVAANAAAASPVHNAIMVDGGGELDARRPSAAERAAFLTNPVALPACSATTGAFDQNACREPTPVQLSAAVAGSAWYDIGSSDRALDALDQRLPGWIVEVVDPSTGALLRSVLTDASGRYRVDDLVPGVPLAVRFRDPASNVVWGVPVNGEAAPGSSGATCDQANAIASGGRSSCVERSDVTRLVVVLQPGQTLAQQSLPVDPSGVVYDSTTRRPVPGSTVTLAPSGTCTGYDPTLHVLNAGTGGYSLNGSATSMTVGPDGFYQFLFASSAPSSCTFAIGVTPPAGYRFVSTAIAPEAGVLSPPGGPGATYEVQAQAQAPSAAPGTPTTYYLLVTAGSGVANIVHNHIPLDPTAPTGIAITKQVDRSEAQIGETVRYTVTVRYVAGPGLPVVTVRDRLPPGFTYIAGTARVNDAPIANPVGGLGPVLGFNVGALNAGNTLRLTYRVRIGVGAQEGDGINLARAHGCGTPEGCLLPSTLAPIAGSVPSNEARAKVRVAGGAFTREACVAGKVFVDCNGNSVQDPEELGVPGVRLYFQSGTWLVSDSEGKYSFCGLPPRSHTLKVDTQTLPRGSRLTTSSNRNLGDAGSLFIDLKAGELHRADFVEGSCSKAVVEQVKARRSQGEVRAPDNEAKGVTPLRLHSKPAQAPLQGTDGADQPMPAVRPRPPSQPQPPSQGASHAR
ncbi:MAG TPA: SdrD B-like domain-containing protein [Piscinibacter sp.]|nr:SdrD B-like domain-containing protein [Piscinibacter sp.]